MAGLFRLFQRHMHPDKGEIFRYFNLPFQQVVMGSMCLAHAPAKGHSNCFHMAQVDECSRRSSLIGSCVDSFQFTHVEIQAERQHGIVLLETGISQVHAVQ